LRNKYCE